MNANIHLQGHCITFEAGEVQRADGSFSLLADIDAAVTIPSGRFAAIPTPIAVQGDGHTLALLNVGAGKDLSQEAIGGEFVGLPADKMIRIVAVVRNETPNALIIHPKNCIGSLDFVVLADPETKAEPAAQPVFEDEPLDNSINVRAVYTPEHIDPTNFPAYATAGSSGMDLRADVAETVTIQPGERRLVKTGLKVSIPQGFEAQVRARSGLAHKHGISLTNGIGSIDADYTGDIGCLILNNGTEAFTFEPGERIAQLVFAPVMQAVFDFQETLEATDRGAGGFGSTGRS